MDALPSLANGSASWLDLGWIRIISAFCAALIFFTAVDLCIVHGIGSVESM
jgi:hypothetical protein